MKTILSNCTQAAKSKGRKYIYGKPLQKVKRKVMRDVLA